MKNYIPFIITFIILIVIILFIFLLIKETLKIRIVHYKVKNGSIEEGMISENNPIRIVYFSDLHLGRFLKKKELNKKIQLLKNLNVDIYLFGGDLIGKNIQKYYTLKDIQECFQPLHGKCLLAVYGNHEYKKDKRITLEDKKAYLAATGFQILQNQEYIYVKDKQWITIYGMDDSIYGQPTLPKKEYHIVLSHEGDIIDQFHQKQWMLSGHTHGGQIRIPLIPFYYRPYKGKKYTHGLFTISSSKLLVSNGLGYGKLKLRLFAPCEIVQIDYQ